MSSQPTPDHKNWTWVLERPCPQCGYDASAVQGSDVGPKIRANAAAWRTLLGRGDIVTERPPVPAGDDPVWSALEYGAHVRDVHDVFAGRLTRMIKKKSPKFNDWDQNKAAVDGRYGEQDPGKVSYDLASNAGKVADILDKVRGDVWERTGSRSDGAEFTVATLAVYLLHDPVHHLWDAEQGIETILEARKAAKSGGVGAETNGDADPDAS